MCLCIWTCSCFCRKGSVFSYRLPSSISAQGEKLGLLLFLATKFCHPPRGGMWQSSYFKCRCLRVPIRRKLASSTTALIEFYPTSWCISKHKMRHLRTLVNKIVLHCRVHTTSQPPEAPCFFFCGLLQVGSIFTKHQCEKRVVLGPKSMQRWEPTRLLLRCF